MSIRVRIGNATVVDVVEQRLLPAHDVFVDGGRIDSVVSAGTKSAPSAETIDASGLFLCPGPVVPGILLINANVLPLLQVVAE